MNKAEFLAALENRLRVLDKREIKDIVGEYAQHIDMKLENGMAEEDAIRDFGSIDELAAEILSAYHIDPAYDEKEEPAALPLAAEAQPEHKGAAYAAWARALLRWVAASKRASR